MSYMEPGQVLVIEVASPTELKCNSEILDWLIFPFCVFSEPQRRLVDIFIITELCGVRLMSFLVG